MNHLIRLHNDICMVYWKPVLIYPVNMKLYYFFRQTNLRNISFCHFSEQNLLSISFFSSFFISVAAWFIRCVCLHIIFQVQIVQNMPQYMSLKTLYMFIPKCKVRLSELEFIMTVKTNWIMPRQIWKISAWKEPGIVSLQFTKLVHLQVSNRIDSKQKYIV